MKSGCAVVVIAVSLLCDFVLAEWTEKEFGIFEQKLTELADQYFPFNQDQNNFSFDGNYIFNFITEINT